MKLGFKFGDSLDLSFSNNVKYNDIGYYSGYYVPAGQELVVGYPGYDYVKFCINYGDDVYTMNKFDKETKVTITVNKSEKYKDIEETLSISYSDDITTYDSKEEFSIMCSFNFCSSIMKFFRLTLVASGETFRKVHGCSPICC